MQGIFSQRLEDLLGGLSELANEEACENDVVWAARTAVLVQQFQVTINHFCFQKISPVPFLFFLLSLFKCVPSQESDKCYRHAVPLTAFLFDVVQEHAPSAALSAFLTGKFE